MPDPQAILTGITSSWMQILPQLMLYLKYTVYMIIMGVIFIALYFRLTYNMKATVYPMFGSGQDGVFSFAKPKKNRVKKVRQGTAWKPMWPLFNRIEIEPFDSEYIYPGKNIYVFELNGQWTPGRVNIDQTEDEIRAQINPVPHVVRNWQDLQHKKHALEFAEHDFWSENKALFIAMIVGLGCLAAVCVTIYFTYSHANGVVGALDRVTGALSMKDVIEGVPR